MLVTFDDENDGSLAGVTFAPGVTEPATKPEREFVRAVVLGITGFAQIGLLNGTTVPLFDENERFGGILVPHFLIEVTEQTGSLERRFVHARIRRLATADGAEHFSDGNVSLLVMPQSGKTEVLALELPETDRDDVSLPLIRAHRPSMAFGRNVAMPRYTQLGVFHRIVTEVGRANVRGELVDERAVELHIPAWMPGQHVGLRLRVTRDLPDVGWSIAVDIAAGSDIRGEDLAGGSLGLLFSPDHHGCVVFKHDVP